MTTHDANTQTPHNSSFGFTEVRPEEKQGLVNQVFAEVASRYDIMNDLMSGGMHRLWKADLINWMAPSPSTPLRLLDVAGGTGDVSRRFIDAAGERSSAVICDISAEMLEAGRKKLEGRYGDRLQFVEGNAEALPFEDRSFDIYTIAFGIRNVTHIDKVLSEAHRVLKIGGRFMCLEFSEVQTPILDSVYDLYSFNVIPHLGRMVAGSAEPYQYLVESIRRFPNQERFAAMIREAGFSRVSYRNLTGGVAAIHSGWRL
jgi:demethylmenaquinone methyltransferase / 2-methoxy-6-polyprenyl-1,4-benzoquinol methylase